MSRIVLAVSLFIVGACQRPPREVVAPRVVEDALHRKLTLGAVQRIVSLAPSSTEIVYALGAGDLVVGVDRFSDFPKEVARLPKVGSDMEPSIEKIIGLKPDLVLAATSANGQRSVEGMSKAGLAVYVSRADSLEAIFLDILGIGRALDRQPQAEALVANMRSRLATARARVHAFPETSCAVVVWPAPLVVAAQGSHVGDLLTAAGGRNVVGNAAQPFPTYSPEKLVREHPAVILVGSHSTGAPPLTALEQLSSIPAVRDRRIHVVDGDLLFRPGPRVVDGVEALVPMLHPPSPAVPAPASPLVEPPT